MANNYYDATGVLILDKVTPIITALFGGFKLDASFPDDGQAYIALIAGDGGAHWDDICEDLATLAVSLGLSQPYEQQPAIGQVLEILSKHFGAGQDEALENLIEHHSFEDDADLDALFLIATRFDDGHGLQAIQFEGCWHCSKPRLFEFGGDGYFISREFEVYGASGQPIQFGNGIRQALLVRDLDKVTELIARETQRLLNGLKDDLQRQQVQQRLRELLR